MLREANTSTVAVQSAPLTHEMHKNTSNQKWGLVRVVANSDPLQNSRSILLDLFFFSNPCAIAPICALTHSHSRNAQSSSGNRRRPQAVAAQLRYAARLMRGGTAVGFAAPKWRNHAARALRGFSFVSPRKTKCTTIKTKKGFFVPLDHNGSRSQCLALRRSHYYFVACAWTRRRIPEIASPSSSTSPATQFPLSHRKRWEPWTLPSTRPLGVVDIHAVD